MFYLYVIKHNLDKYVMFMYVVYSNGFFIFLFDIAICYDQTSD